MDRKKEQALKALNELAKSVEHNRNNPPEQYSDEWKEMGEIHGWCHICCEPMNLCDGCLPGMTL